MQCILREKLLTQATKLVEVSNIYRSESHHFVDAYINWLEESEKDLSGLRSPIIILLQAEKSLLISVLDGYLPSNIQNGKNLRKSQKAVAAQSLEKISKEIYAKIEAIDRTFDQLNENLCQAVAVLASKVPAAFDNLPVDQHGVDTIWEMLGRTPETIPMYNYIGSKLSTTDRNYLMVDIIQKIMSNRRTSG